MNEEHKEEEFGQTNLERNPNPERMGTAKRKYKHGQVFHFRVTDAARQSTTPKQRQVSYSQRLSLWDRDIKEGLSDVNHMSYIIHTNRITGDDSGAPLSCLSCQDFAFDVFTKGIMTSGGYSRWDFGKYQIIHGCMELICSTNCVFI